MAYSFSRTWKSEGLRGQESRRTTQADRAQELDRFRRINAQLKLRYKEGQAMIPWTFDAWLSHRAAVAQAEHEDLSRKMSAIEQTRRELAILKEETGHTHLRLYGGGVDRPGGTIPWPNYSAVLCEKTIWCQDYKGRGHIGEATWPDAWELKFEGDDRVNSEQWPDYRRFFPLPRLLRITLEPPGQWSLRTRVFQHDFDEVSRKKTHEDIYYPVDEVDDETGKRLLGSALADFL